MENPEIGETLECAQKKRECDLPENPEHRVRVPANKARGAGQSRQKGAFVPKGQGGSGAAAERAAEAEAEAAREGAEVPDVQEPANGGALFEVRGLRAEKRLREPKLPAQQNYVRRSHELELGSLGSKRSPSKSGGRRTLS